MRAEVVCHFDIQRFSLHDGPGIRTTVFLKGCPLRCPWCQNPESLRSEPELAFHGDRCRACGACAQRCPRGAINAPNEELPRVVRERCDACGRCVDACPYGALRVVGQAREIGTVVEELERDRPFFEASGGGITLSGGEPTYQMEAMAALAGRCRERDLSVGVQTCGLFEWSRFEPHLRQFNLVQFDLKLMEPEEHRRIIGADNELILANARRLAASGARLQFRMPIVPGLTDAPTNLERIAAFLGQLGVRRLALLRYHAMGEPKLERLGFPRPAFRLPSSSPSAAAIENAGAFLRRAGLEVGT
jgi:pyruvate formate lyase activating enzyme